MTLLVDPAAAALAGLRIGVEQIGRPPVDRHFAAGLAGAAAAYLRLVIAGREGGAVADLDQLEIPSQQCEVQFAMRV